MLEPNYLSGITGGISLSQYQKIKDIPDIEVAAPIAVIGYAPVSVNLGNLYQNRIIDRREHGVYRFISSFISNPLDRNRVELKSTSYFTNGWFGEHSSYFDPENATQYGVGSFSGDLGSFNFVLLVGIDPVQEARLVGLDQATLSTGKSRYFNEQDRSQKKEFQLGDQTVTEIKIPVLLSNQAFIEKTYQYTVEKLDLPFDTLEAARKTMEQIKTKGGKKYLDTIKTVDQQTVSYNADQVHEAFLRNLTGVDPKTGQETKFAQNNSLTLVNLKATPLNYDAIPSPFPDRWSLAFQVTPPKISEKEKVLYDQVFREMKVYPEEPRLDLQWIGLYDPEKLQISKDPLTQLPMETYRSAYAQLVLDAEGKPVNPPEWVKPVDDPLGLLTGPPTLLTTLDAAGLIMGEEPISSIRIKVKGVDSLNEESQRKLERVARDIEGKTGLITDITLGSSPQPTLVFVPKNGNTPALGWMEQLWVRIGAAIAIFHETKLGFSGIIAVVLLVAILYVLATHLVSVLARRKELAVLLAVGWRPTQLFKMVFMESVLLGSFVALISWAIVGLSILQSGTSISWLRFFLVGFLGFLVYLFGAVWGVILIAKISPYEAIRSGEMRPHARRIVRAHHLMGMAFNHLWERFTRSLLSILSMAIPTTLLVFFLFVTAHLQGILYTTWLGQYIAVEIGPAHYIAMFFALIISVMTTAEIMWQNVSERKPEIALLKAIGWRDSSIRILVLMEGGLIGLVAGVIGVGLGLLFIGWMYRQFPWENFLLLLSTGLVPLVVGFIGSFFPAEIAVKNDPSQGMRA